MTLPRIPAILVNGTHRSTRASTTTTHYAKRAPYGIVSLCGATWYPRKHTTLRPSEEDEIPSCLKCQEVASTSTQKVRAYRPEDLQNERLGS